LVEMMMSPWDEGLGIEKQPEPEAAEVKQQLLK
jgi:hypothetical protein